MTNEEVHSRIQNAIGVHNDLLIMVKKRKLRWYSHISRFDLLAKTILQETMKGARGKERQKKRWEYDIKEWTGMGFVGSLRAAEDRKRYCCNIIGGAPTSVRENTGYKLVRLISLLSETVRIIWLPSETVR